MTELQSDVDKGKEEVTKEVFLGPKTSREWTPIDNYNNQYVDHLLDRSSSGNATNYIAENKVT